MEAVTALASELVGWTPIAIDLEASAPWVEWTDLATPTFDEAFFGDTIRRHLAQASARTVASPPQLLATIGAQVEAVGPSGFVFHGSRCGSTALAHALAAVSGTLMVREPVVLARALAQRGLDREAIAGLVRCLVQRRSAAQRHAFVKLSSWAVLYAGALQPVFSAVPCAFVYRDPLEVAVSLLERPPQWTALLRSGRLGRIDALTTAEERVAYVVGAFYRAALACPGMRLVEYRAMVADVAGTLARTFGLVLDEADRQAVQAAMATDAKDRRASFRPDGAAKRAAASVRLHEAVQRHARPAYDALEERRARSAS